MTLRLDGLYDIIVELEEKIEDVKLRRKAVEQDAITLENIYTLLSNFDKVNDKISDEEKKPLISSLIKEIEIFPCDESELPLKVHFIQFSCCIKTGEMFTNFCGTKGHMFQRAYHCPNHIKYLFISYLPFFLTFL